MTSLSEVRGEAALELLADVMEPASVILDDAEVREAFRVGKNRIRTAAIVLKRHKKEMLEILAAVNMTPVEDYRPNPYEVMRSTINVLSDPGLTDFFGSQAPKKAAGSSGPALAIIEAPKE